VDEAATAARLAGERAEARASARDLAAILAWTRAASSTIGESLNAVCGAACVVLDAPSAALLEREDDGWRVTATSGLPHDVVGRPVDALGRLPLADAVEPVPIDALPPGLAAVAGHRSATALLWGVPDGDEAPHAAVVVLLPPGASAALGPRQRFALEVLGVEAGTALERTALLTRLDRLARVDALTGLPNRRCWEEELPRLLHRAHARSEPLCVALLDLDRFKAFNDARGHAAGDRLLRTAAAAWSGALREQDLLARYGGEEFAVVLPSCSMADAAVAIDRLRKATPDGQTCSAGLAEWDGVEPLARLLDRADDALYSAKRRGRDRVVVARADGDLDDVPVGSPSEV
jgi:diguanylate cyclase (GGDEF)-like protein